MSFRISRRRARTQAALALTVITLIGARELFNEVITSRLSRLVVVEDKIPTDSESLLARGTELCPLQLSAYDWQLIKGLNRGNRQTLIQSRASLRGSFELGQALKTSLEQIKGIGPKTSATLLSQLSWESCSRDDNRRKITTSYEALGPAHLPAQQNPVKDEHQLSQVGP